MQSGCGLAGAHRIRDARQEHNWARRRRLLQVDSEHSLSLTKRRQEGR